MFLYVNENTVNNMRWRGGIVPHAASYWLIVKKREVLDVRAIVPVLGEVLRTGRKIGDLALAKDEGRFLLLPAFAQHFLPLYLQIGRVPVTVVLLGKEIVVIGAEGLTGDVLPKTIPPRIFGEP